ncbi:TIGR03118 family protein [Pontibacter liquoris]|uniref:TIGR03118 family protein n=1 Tax=Pontibacter liquoris TaxID=2905677 RepID=UPI001FA774FB|nr:TIGR03118 family protein [Pontibacter liquoris]
MKKILNPYGFATFRGAATRLLMLTILLLGAGCDQLQDQFPDLFPKGSQNLKGVKQVNLVANTSKEYNAQRVDSKFVNGWGIAFSPTGVIWPNAEGTGLSFIYKDDGTELRGPVAIPSPDGAKGGHPSGIVFNGTNGFKLPNGDPARFIFDGTDGVISAWNGGDEAVRVKDNSSKAAYTGLAMAADGNKNYLYAANFKSRKIEVYDSNFKRVEGKKFEDPDLPDGYAPFNIQSIGDKLYVMYAKVGSNGEEAAGAGNGYVDIYTPNGHLVRRFASKGTLNAPWGVAQAPDGFLMYENKDIEAPHNAILVGNFGDGHISVYTSGGEYIGQLKSGGKTLVIDGLWAIMFPPSSASSVDQNRLYFAAGPDDETHGLFGYLAPEK